MFHKNISIEKINSFSEDTLLAHLQIEFTEIGDHFLTAKMPVNKNNSQPMGILHGGAMLFAKVTHLLLIVLLLPLL